METGPSSRLLAAVAVPRPLEVGATFPRVTWPSHVTLAPTFFVGTATDEIVGAIRALCEGEGPMTIRFGEVARFGRDEDIPVQLVDSARILTLHERIADVLETFPHFVAEEAHYWRAGFRPHMTHVAGRDTPEGSELSLRHVVIADIDGADASVLDQFPL